MRKLRNYYLFNRLSSSLLSSIKAQIPPHMVSFALSIAILQNGKILKFLSEITTEIPKIYTISEYFFDCI